MRVINQGGYLHDHITALRLEEGCRLHGRKKIFHRIWGFDGDRQQEIVLDWGTDLEEVRECIRKMRKRLNRGITRPWNCPACGLKKK